MEPDFWHERWRTGDIGFHRPEVHDLLIRHWPELGLAKGSEVLVPLCGKSRDMAWLAAQGHRVIGVELVEMAIDDFFAAEGLTPAIEFHDGFLVKRAEPYALWCGDIFALPPAVTAGVAGVYDRASLVAFPPAEQPRFADALARLTPASVPLLLIGLEFDSAEMTGPPFPAPRARVRDMLRAAFDITELEAREVLSANPGLAKRGLSGLTETALVLTRR
ncbi:MAG: thiopurine S-methyltransferase [Pseudomonadota bacterium]